MTQTVPRFLNVAGANGTSARIACEYVQAALSHEPGMVWFPGLNSTMSGTKATALKEWAERTNRSLVCFDYSGHGSSEGEFSDGTIGQWLHESLAILREVAEGPQILAGSSMGAWLVLLILRAIASGDPQVRDICPVEGAFLISPAIDMTEDLMWQQITEEARLEIEVTGFYDRPSRYGDGSYRISRKLIEEGRNHLIGEGTFKPPCPVRIMHGIADPDVPWRHANKLTHTLLGENVMLSLIQDGDHRLSRVRDINKMLGIIHDLYASIEQQRVYT